MESILINDFAENSYELDEGLHCCGSEKMVYKILLGSPHPSDRIRAGSSGERSRVQDKAEVFPIG
jgi:hypothetical protein